MAHAHIVKDSDNHFIIDPITRQLSSNSKKTILIKTDHNSEQFTFELPRYVEGHDMSTCNKVEVHYININSKTRQQSVGIYNVVDFGIDAEDNTKVLGTWLVSREATKYAGSLNFVLRFGCVSADEVEEYSWNTAIYTGISITDGICNTETVVEDYVDILRQWLDTLEMAGSTGDIYAISDDGTIINLCEKVDGLDSHVTELEAQITEFGNQVTDFGDRVTGVEQDASTFKQSINTEISEFKESVNNEVTVFKESVNNQITTIDEKIPTKISDLENDSSFVLPSSVPFNSIGMSSGKRNETVLENDAYYYIEYPGASPCCLKVGSAPVYVFSEQLTIPFIYKFSVNNDNTLNIQAGTFNITVSDGVGAITGFVETNPDSGTDYFQYKKLS